MPRGHSSEKLVLPDRIELRFTTMHVLSMACEGAPAFYVAEKWAAFWSISKVRNGARQPKRGVRSQIDKIYHVFLHGPG